MKIWNVLAMMAMGLCVMACGNDDDENTPDNGSTTAISQKFTDFDASAYDQWVYINLKSGETEKHPVAGTIVYPTQEGTTEEAGKSEENVNIDWHIAIHRYEIKTNGGSALKTSETDMSKVTSLPEGNYVADKTSSYAGSNEFNVIVDMTQMMQGKVGYAKSFSLNETLCGWMTKTATGTMPPYVYEVNKNVFVVKYKDGSWAKLQFTVVGNSTNSKSGYLSFNSDFYSK